MLSKEENARLTRVGPGTPVGDLLRRYWHPVAASSQLPIHGTKAVKLLGESLVLYRDRSGTAGLMGDRCPHRRAGMIFGVPEEQGLRCAYHGWVFDETGRCTEQPYEQTEDPDSTFRHRVKITAYPVVEKAGLIFAYLGPEPAPLLPAWDLYEYGPEVPRDIGVGVIPCNWLQITENSLDPVHAEWLHGVFDGYVMEKQGRPEKARSLGKHKKIGFEVFEHGIIKKRVVDDNTEEHEDWTVGHPLVFPNMLKAGSAKHPVFQIRTPMDDENTLHFWYGVHLVEGVEAPSDPRRIPHYKVPMPEVDPEGEIRWDQLENNSGQDVAMWVTQGLIADRSQEHLGLSDRGIILYRHMLSENVERVREGEDPINVFRSPHAPIKLAVEQAKLGGRAGYQPGGRQTGNATKYSPVIATLEAQRKTPQTVS